jgi:hypothetical protein
MKKASMKEALNALIDSETTRRMTLTTNDLEAVKQKMDTVMEANPSSTNSTHMMGTHDESH